MLLELYALLGALVIGALIGLTSITNYMSNWYSWLANITAKLVKILKKSLGGNRSLNYVFSVGLDEANVEIIELDADQYRYMQKGGRVFRLCISISYKSNGIRMKNRKTRSLELSRGDLVTVYYTVNNQTNRYEGEVITAPNSYHMGSVFDFCYFDGNLEIVKRLFFYSPFITKLVIVPKPDPNSRNKRALRKAIELARRNAA